VKCADRLIDMGPEGGEEGGMVIAAGTPEEVAAEPQSHTGRFLAEILGTSGGGAKKTRGKAAAGGAPRKRRARVAA
jgi:excinuclease ABC subunit A